MRYQNVNVKIPVSMYNKMKKLVDDGIYISMSEIVRLALKNFLEGFEDDD